MAEINKTIKNNDWYRKWFNHFYPKLYPHRSLAEAEFQVNAVINLIRTRENCLDIACGTGRHLRYLAKYFNRTVGLDLSKDLIEIGRLEGNFDNSEVYISDMRSPPFSEKFDLVTNFFTGLGYFQSDQEHLELLKNWKGLVKPTGTLLIDYLNRDYVINNIVPSSDREIDGYNVTETRSLSPDGLRIEKNIVISKNDFKENYFESVRMYTSKEVMQMLKESGFKTIDIFGDFDWNAFTTGSERLILVAKNA